MSAEDTIAIVGLSCRFPGAMNVDEFWRVLINGENRVTEIPKERWNNDAFYDANKDAPGKSYVRHAAFVDKFDEFDNRLFAINDSEAARMDPQQKWLLECVHQAFENAGITNNKVNGKEVGVFVGVMNVDYSNIVNADSTAMNNYSTTGVALSIASNRINYTWNLHGPSVSIDTACSSSLVATHFGIQSLLSEDCEMVLCGGANFIMQPDVFVGLSRARMISESGKCQPFSASADGYVRGEGCSIIVLKKLDKAIRDGDRIWGTIVTGTNQDGRTATPITAPSSIQQEALMRRLYSKHNVDPRKIHYIEAHGTGTPVGDPIEARSLGGFIGRARSDTEPRVLIGSVKSNIGHLEAVAGLAGLLKVLLMMKHEQIVPTLHFTEPNPAIDLDYLKLRVATEVTEWPEDPEVGRMSCVNSFGFGGSNSHAVVQQYKMPEEIQLPARTDVVCVSAANIWSLEQSILDLGKAVTSTDIPYESIAYTSALRRTHYPYRLAVKASSLPFLESELNRVSGSFSALPTPDSKEKKVVFVFCGMGPKWLGMCLGFMASEPVFREKMNEIDSLFQKLSGWSLIDRLNSKEIDMRPSSDQPLLFASQVCLYSQWRHWGIKPDAIIGFSVGEVAAGHCAGCYPLDEAVRLIYWRGKLQDEVTGGKMLTVGNIPLEKCREICSNFSGAAEIAAEATKTACTLTGDSEAMDAIKKQLEEANETTNDKIFFRELNVSAAYHSRQMDPICKKLTDRLHDFRGTEPSVPIISTVTGRPATADDFSTPQYWSDNLRKGVLFLAGLESIIDPSKHHVFVEIGPRPVLRAYIKEIVGKNSYTLVRSMMKDGERDTMLQAVCDLYMAGLNPNWEEIFKGRERFPVDLPRYVFKRNKALYDPDQARLHRMGLDGQTRAGNHPFIEQVPSDAHMFRSKLSRDQTPFVFDHVVQGAVVVPGAMYVELGLHSARAVTERRYPVSAYRVNIKFLSPVTIKPEGTAELITTLIPREDDDSMAFKISQDGRVKSQGNISISQDGQSSIKRIDIGKLRRRCETPVSVAEMYDHMAYYGLTYGPLMRILKDGYAFHDKNQEAIAMIEIPDHLLSDAYSVNIHPVIMDNLLQMPGVLHSGIRADTNLGPFLPSKISSVVVRKPMERRMWAYTTRIYGDDMTIGMNSALLSESGEVIVECRDFHITRSRKENEFDIDDRFSYKTNWQPLSPEITDAGALFDEDLRNIGQTAESSYPVSSDRLPVCLVFADADGIAEKLKSKIHPDSVFISIADFTSRDWKKHETRVHELLKSRGKRFEDFHSIVYCWAICLKDPAGMRVEDINAIIQSSCAGLRQLLKAVLKEGPSKLPQLKVVTCSTQRLLTNDDAYHHSVCEPNPFNLGEEGDLGEEHRVNILGLPIWGTMRCLAKERIYQDSMAVELCHGSDVEIQALVDEIISGAHADYAEIMFCHDSVYVVEFGRYEGDHTQILYRENRALANTDALCLLTTHTTALQNLHCRYWNPKTPEIHMTGDVDVQIESAHLHSQAFFPITVDGLDPMNEVYWPVDRSVAYGVMGIDFLGRVKCSGSSRIKDGDSVVVCFPHEIRTRLVVPSRFVFNRGEIAIPEARDCLSYYVIAWEALIGLAKLEKSDSLVVIGRSVYGLLGRVIANSAKRMGLTRAVFCEAKAFMKLNDKVKCIIALGEFDKLVSDKMTNLLAPNGRVVFFRGTADLDPTAVRVISDRPDVRLYSINPRQSFQPAILSDSLPNVIQWLKKITPANARKYSKTSLENEVVDNEKITLDRVSLVKDFAGDANDSGFMSLDTVAEGAKLRVFEFSTRGNQKSLPVQVDEKELFRKNALYLLAGGNRGLGLELLTHMASKGAGYLVPISRSSPSDTVKKHFHKLEDMYGVKIIPLQVDIKDYPTLENAVTVLRRELPNVPIKGVFQGAVVIRDAMLTNLSQSLFAEGTDAKILGTWNLHIATLNDSLDYFVMHSSTASVCGNGGQSAYATGNIFMDGMAHYRKSLGLPGQTINWNVLNVGVMLENEAAEAFLKSIGYLSLEIEEIMQCFDYALMQNKTQISFGKYNWEDYYDAFLDTPYQQKNARKMRPVMLEGRELKMKRKIVAAAAGIQETRLIRPADVMAVSGPERVGLVKEYIFDVVAKVFASDVNSFNGDTTIVSLGIDSMVAMNLQQKIKQEMKINLPVVVLQGQDTCVNTLIEVVHNGLGANEDTTLTQDDDVLITDEPLLQTLCTEEHARQVEMGKMGGTPAFNLLMTFYVHDIDSNPEIWQKLFKVVIDRHPVLHTTYEETEDPEHEFGLKPIVHESDEYELDFRIISDIEDENDVEAIVEEKAHEPIDILNEQPVRIFFVPLEERKLFYGIVFHHIAVDPFSLQTFMRDYRDVAIALVAGNDPPPKPSRFEYGNFMKTRQEILNGRGEELESFWKRTIRNDLQPMDLPFEKSRPPLYDTRNGGYMFENVDKNEIKKINLFLSETGITLYHFYAALFQTLLYHYTGKQTIVTACPSDMRISMPEYFDVVGCGVNDISLVSDLSDPTTTFRQFVKRIRGTVTTNMQYGIYPVVRIPALVGLPSDQSRLPIYQHSVTLIESGAFVHREMERKVDMGHEYVNTMQLGARMDTRLTIIHSSRNNSILLDFNYNKSIFTDEDGVRIFNDVKALVSTVLESPDTQLRKLPIRGGTFLSPEFINATDVSADTRDASLPRVKTYRGKSIFEDVNKTDFNIALPSQLHKIFLKSARMKPATVALKMSGKTTTYKDLLNTLYCIATKVALSSKIGETGDVSAIRPTQIGLMAENTPSAIASILAIWSLGYSAFLFNPDWSPTVIRTLVRDYPIRVFLVSNNVIKKEPLLWDDHRYELIVIESCMDTKPKQHEFREHPDNIACSYVDMADDESNAIAVSHFDILNRLMWNWRKYPYSNRDVAALRTPLCHIQVLWQLLTPLLYGVPTVLMPPETMNDIRRLVQELTKNSVTRLGARNVGFWTSLSSFLVKNSKKLALKYIYTNGRSMSLELLRSLRRVLPSTTIVSIYQAGRNIGTAVVAEYRPGEEITEVRVGMPTINTKAFVLNAAGHPCRTEESGTLYIAGVGIGLEEENVRTLPDGTVAVNTGDTVVMKSDGNLVLECQQDEVQMLEQSWNNAYDALSIIEKGAMFSKQTENGWSHSRFVRVRLHGTVAEQCLLWGTSKHAVRRRIPLRDIKDVKTLDSKGQSAMIIITEYRDYVFRLKKADQDLLEMWVSGLRKAYEMIATTSSRVARANSLDNLLDFGVK